MTDDVSQEQTVISPKKKKIKTISSLTVQQFENLQIDGDNGLNITPIKESNQSNPLV